MNIPAMAANRINDPLMVEELLQDGYCAFIVSPADAAHVVEADYFGIATTRQVGHALYEGQAQPVACRGPRGIGLVKLVEDARQGIGRDAVARIGDRDAGGAVCMLAVIAIAAIMLYRSRPGGSLAAA